MCARPASAPRAPAVYFSDFAEMCRQGGLLAEGEQAARRAVALAPNFARGVEQSRHHPAGDAEARRKPALPRAGARRSSPTIAETFNNLANTLKRLGLAAEAEKRWNAALALKPDYAEAYSNLSNLLHDQGEYDRAEAMARRAIELSSAARRRLYQPRRGRDRAPPPRRCAAAALDALLAFAPAHPRALAARALTLKELDRLDEALDTARRAAAAGAG